MPTGTNKQTNEKSSNESLLSLVERCSLGRQKTFRQQLFQTTPQGKKKQQKKKQCSYYIYPERTKGERVTRHLNTPTGFCQRRLNREPGLSSPPSGNTLTYSTVSGDHIAAWISLQPEEIRCLFPSLLQYHRSKPSGDSGLSTCPNTVQLTSTQCHWESRGKLELSPLPNSNEELSLQVLTEAVLVIPFGDHSSPLCSPKTSFRESHLK